MERPKIPTEVNTAVPGTNAYYS